jgi:hypothetical protein
MHPRSISNNGLYPLTLPSYLKVAGSNRTPATKCPGALEEIRTPDPQIVVWCSTVVTLTQDSIQGGPRLRTSSERFGHQNGRERVTMDRY